MSSVVRLALTGLVASAVGTVVKTKAEGFLQPRAEKWFPPAAGEKSRLGADGSDHPENMPPAEIVGRAAQAVTGDEPSDDDRVQAATPLHWAMGLGAGLLYTLVGARRPAVRRSWGLGFGAALFAVTHGSVLPALKLQDAPTTMPAAWWVWEPGSHLVYGVAVDTALRALDYLGTD